MARKITHYSPGDEVVFDGARWMVVTFTDEDGEQYIEREGKAVIAHVDDLSWVDPLEF